MDQIIENLLTLLGSQANTGNQHVSGRNWQIRPVAHCTCGY